MWAAAVVLVLATLWSAPTRADEIRYPVEAGDTLIGVGHALLAEPRHWRRLQRLNRIADPYRIPVGTELRIPVGWLRPQPRRAVVVAAVGEVRADGRALQAGDEISAGTELRTGDRGHLTLKLPDGSTLSLPASSAARLQALRGYAGTESQEADLRLERGRVESQVAPQRGPAARYRVQTPTAVIGVRGTAFRVGADGSAVRAEVTAGRVEVSSTDAVSGREVDAGYGLMLRPGGALPQAVALLQPPDVGGLPGRFEQPVVRFEVPPVAGARAYRVQVAADPAFAEVLAEQVVPAAGDAGRDGGGKAEARIAGLDDGDYVLRLRAIDAEGIEGRDAEHAFRLKARPEPPILNAPVDGGKVVEGPVELRWALAPQAASYRIQIATDAGFSVLVGGAEKVEGTTFGMALEAGEYFWRAASVRPDGDVGPWSTASRVVVRPRPQVPPPPTVGDDGLDFHWAGEAGQRFDYQLARDPGFADLVAEGGVAEPRLSLPRPPGGDYFIRVRAIDADGYVSPWSSAQQIVVPKDFPWWSLLMALPLLAL